MDQVSQMMAYEEGELDAEQTIELFRLCGNDLPAIARMPPSILLDLSFAAFA